MNDRLELDKNMTHPKYEKQSLSGKLVLSTWKGALLNEARLPDDWLGISGVLVGMVAEDRS